MPRLRWSVLAMIPCLVLLSGCSEAATFNNTLAGLTKELETSGRKFGERVAGNLGNRDKLEDAYADVVGEVADIAKRGRKVTVPNDKEAKTFHEAFLAYLDFEEHMVDYDFHKIMTHAAGMDRAAIMDVIERLQKRELKEIAVVKAAQKAYAEAKHVTIME
jgi:hypothetical protein